MEKKRILVLMHYMELGGAESALLGLLMAHDPSRAQMDVFIYDHRGPLMNFIPRDSIHLLPPIKEYSVLERPIKELIKRGFWGIAISRIFSKIQTGLFIKKNFSNLNDASSFTFQQKATLFWLPKINPKVQYDLVVSFHSPHFIAVKKVNSKKTLGWIHNDYTKLYVNPKMENEMWGALDFIASISDDVGAQFCAVFPNLKNKLQSIENIISSDFVRLKSNSIVPKEILLSSNHIILLSIGRFCNQKRFDQIGNIANRLQCALTSKDSLYSFHWYLIGYGSSTEEELIRKNIKDWNVNNIVSIVGKRDNPYPYIKVCDIYVQPSRYEGKSITVREAQILGKPVAVSAYPTASSQIQHGIDGVILPMDIDGFASGLADFIMNEELRMSISDYVSKHQYGNESEIEKIYKLIDA